MKPLPERPTGAVAIAIVFFCAAIYLCTLGLLMLLRPGSVAMALGAPLLGGLELAGPYMFLLTGGMGAAIGGGLLHMNNWARRAAILVAMIGVVMLIPTVSGAVVGFEMQALAAGGAGVILRVVIVWYLFQAPVAEQFAGSKRAA